MNKTYTHEDLAMCFEIAKDVTLETGIVTTVNFTDKHIVISFSNSGNHIHDCDTIDEAISTLAGFISGFKLASN